MLFDKYGKSTCELWDNVRGLKAVCTFVLLFVRQDQATLSLGFATSALSLGFADWFGVGLAHEALCEGGQRVCQIYEAGFATSTFAPQSFSWLM